MESSHGLQVQAGQLDRVHRRRARRARALRRIWRVLLLLLLVAIGFAVWRYVPLAEWWDTIRDTSTGAE